MSQEHPTNPTANPELGRRIRSARAYAGITAQTLAAGMSTDLNALERLEAGIQPLDPAARRTVITIVSQQTGCPEQFFTADFSALDGEEPPESKLDRLERKIDVALAAMDSVVAEAREQMTRGGQQLDRFMGVQGGAEGRMVRMERMLAQLAREHPDFDPA